MVLSKLAIVLGAGIIGTALPMDWQLLDVTRLFSGAFKIVTMLSQQEKNGTRSTSKPQSDFLLAEVNTLREQLQLLGKSTSVTVITGSGSGSGRFSVTTIIVIGALGYVIIWWKGWKLSDMMFVTQRGFTESRNRIGRQLDLLSSSIGAAKRHLTSKINQVDKKLQECKELTVATKDEVVELHKDLNLAHTDLEAFQRAVQDLDTKLERIEGTQEKTSTGVYNLCRVVKRLEEERNKRLLEQERNRKLVEQNRKKELIQTISSTPLSIKPASSSESKPAASASSYTALENRRVVRSTTIISVSGLKELEGLTSTMKQRGPRSTTATEDTPKASIGTTTQLDYTSKSTMITEDTPKASIRTTTQLDYTSKSTMITEDTPKASNGTTPQRHDTSKSSMTIEDVPKTSYGTTTQRRDTAQPSVRASWKFPWY
ncbi:uncharacterized protein LOC122020526 [Zingiber officinale]|uniref:uncharacterized protein LOC122020526 n=1 Tax=Zingiber officinale TaxID=94328 RepID=UPI001C4D68D8|nr:uncharacterized protein LOC122020526 [Zingiber officinale]